MRVAPRASTFVAAAFIAGTMSVIARAQSAPVASLPQPSSADWRVSSGYGWFALRDIARTGQPVDASPIEWHGQGLTVEAARTRTNGTRLHRVDVAAAMVGNFEYRSPLASVDRPEGDHYRAIDGRYEYRRYFFDNLLLDGLDVGIGVQGLGQYTSLSRNVSASITANESTLGVGTAVVVAARLRRWAGVQGEIAWTNGGMISRLHGDHSEGGQTSSTWGGGWLTQLTVMADVRLTRQTSLALRYFGAGEGLQAGHRNAAWSRGSFSAGVTYAK